MAIAKDIVRSAGGHPLKTLDTHLLTIVLGLVLLLMGGIWALQGLGLMRGSVMTGQSLWLVLGVLAALVGVGLVVWSLRARPSKA